MKWMGGLLNREIILGISELGWEGEDDRYLRMLGRRRLWREQELGKYRAIGNKRSRKGDQE